MSPLAQAVKHNNSNISHVEVWTILRRCLWLRIPSPGCITQYCSRTWGLKVYSWRTWLYQVSFATITLSHLSFNPCIQVLEVAVKRQDLQRAFVRQALDSLDHGFDALDRNLIYHSSLVGDLYEEFYRRFAQTVQVSQTKWPVDQIMLFLSHEAPHLASPLWTRPWGWQLTLGRLQKYFREHANLLCKTARASYLWKVAAWASWQRACQPTCTKG